MSSPRHITTCPASPTPLNLACSATCESLEGSVPEERMFSLRWLRENPLLNTTVGEETPANKEKANRQQSNHTRFGNNLSGKDDRVEMSIVQSTIGKRPS